MGNVKNNLVGLHIHITVHAKNLLITNNPRYDVEESAENYLSVLSEKITNYIRTYWCEFDPKGRLYISSKIIGIEEQKAFDTFLKGSSVEEKNRHYTNKSDLLFICNMLGEMDFNCVIQEILEIQSQIHYNPFYLNHWD